MMEFTYNGIVRYGFGFYNPNHAAALICAILPFLWVAWIRWKHWAIRATVILTSFLLLAALALTFSRTGALVLVLELLMFCVLTKGINWKFTVAVFAVFLFLLSIGGILTRFTLDSSAMNRLDIWSAGVKLVSMNPLWGVGIGNSGKLASTFVLPDGVICRTLINSHLTLLVEFGFFAGLIWGTLIIYAIANGLKKTGAWTAFAGLCISAFSASIFDWDVLFDFIEYGTLTLSNFILSWTLFCLFITLLIYLSCGNFNWKKATASCLLASLIIIGILSCTESSRTLKIQGEYIVCKGSASALVLYEESFTLKQILPFLTSGYYLPLHSQCNIVSGLPRTQKVILFGKKAELADNFTNEKLIFVSPPEYFQLPPNTEKLYLNSWSVFPDLEKQAQQQNVSVEKY